MQIKPLTKVYLRLKMFRRKNKIKQSLNNLDDTQQAFDPEFESLANVKQKQRDKNIFYRLFVKQYKDGVINVKNKYYGSINYFKKNYLRIFCLAFILFFVATFVLTAYLCFSPFVINLVGNENVNISNFYVANNNKISGLTILGYLLCAFVFVSIILGIISFLYLKKEDKLIVKYSKLTKILSILAYVFILISFLIILIFVLIPPPIFSSLEAQQIRNYMVLIDNASDDSTKIQLISELKNFIDNGNLKVLPISAPTIEAYVDWLRNSGYLYSLDISTYTFIYNSFLQSNVFTLSILGIILIVFFTLFAFLGFIALPVAIYLFKILHEIDYEKIDENIKSNWGFAKKTIYSLRSKFSKQLLDEVSKIKKQKQEHKSFHKYKKQLEEKGIRTLATDEALSGTEINVVKQGVQWDEILKNPANVAFLSKDGKWMYHDGNRNVFESKADQWVPYDVDKEIHKANANIIDDNLNLSPSQKRAKESRFKFGSASKKQSEIALPDAEIDEIVKDLDI